MSKTNKVYGKEKVLDRPSDDKARSEAILKLLSDTKYDWTSRRAAQECLRLELVPQRQLERAREIAAIRFFKDKVKSAKQKDGSKTFGSYKVWFVIGDKEVMRVAYRPKSLMTQSQLKFHIDIAAANKAAVEKQFETEFASVNKILLRRGLKPLERDRYNADRYNEDE